MPTKITETYVKSVAVPTTGSTSVWDSELTGLMLRVNSKGSRSFAFDYRLNGHGKRIGIGKWPAWSVKEARAKAEGYRKRVDSGADPAGEKRERATAATIADLIARYERDHLPNRKRFRQGKDSKAFQKAIKEERRMTGEIAGILGKHTKVASVHFGDLEELHRKITHGYHDGKKLRKPRPVRANRVLAVASIMFNMSLKPLPGEDKAWRTQLDGNPCKGVKRNPEEQCGRMYTVAELAAIGDALAEYTGEVARDCARLIMLTGARPIEAKQAMWSQFDREPGIWIKPPTATKQGKEHRVPLSAPALQLVEQLRAKREPGLQFVFPGRSSEGTIDKLNHCWDHVRDRGSVLLWDRSGDQRIAGIVATLRAGLQREPTAKECLNLAEASEVELPVALLGKAREDQSRLYDLRHSLARHAGGSGASLLIIAKILGHSSQRTTERYAKLLGDDPLKAAIDKATERMLGTPEDKGNVTTLSR
jgi:integrase